MIFSFTVEQIAERAKSHDITPNECLSIWELLDRKRFEHIIDDLLINPMCNPQVLKLALGELRYAVQALRNPSLDLYIYRDEKLIDESCIHFLDAIFNNLNHEDHKDVKRFISLAIKIFEPSRLCTHNLYGFMDEATRKQLALAYFSDTKNSLHSPQYALNSKISDFGIKTLRETKDPDILQAVYDAYPKFNIETLRLFANNPATPPFIIQALTTQLTEYLSVDKGNIYYEKVLNELKDHPNLLVIQAVEQIEQASSNKTLITSITSLDDPLYKQIERNLQQQHHIIKIKDGIVDDISSSRRIDFFRSANDLIERNKKMANERKSKRIGDDLLKDDIFS